MARKSLAAELREFTEFFEENKGIKVAGVTRKAANVYRVTTHNTEYDVTVTRDKSGAITRALISF